MCCSLSPGWHERQSWAPKIPKVAEASRNDVNPACAAIRAFGTPWHQLLLINRNRAHLHGAPFARQSRVSESTPELHGSPTHPPFIASPGGEQLELQWVDRDWARLAWTRRSQGSLCFGARGYFAKKSPRYRISALVVTPCCSRSLPLFAGGSGKFSWRARATDSAPTTGCNRSPLSWWFRIDTPPRPLHSHDRHAACKQRVLSTLDRSKDSTRI